MLHSHIINFRLKEAINLIKQPGTDLDLFDTDDGLTPLQRASREGQEEVVKNLLLAGAAIDRVNDRFNHKNPWIQSQARKTALSLAMQSGHLSIARILIVAGAIQETEHETVRESKRSEIPESKKALTSSIAELSGLLLWIIENDTNDTPNKFFNDVLQAFIKKSESSVLDLDQHFAGLLEFAAQRKKANFTKAFLAARKDKVRCDFNIPSAAYWAALNMPDMFDQLCTTDQHWIVALLQLQQQGKGSTNEELFQKASPERQDRLTKGEDTYDLEEKLSANLRRIYRVAGQNGLVSKHYLTKTEDVYQLILYAYQDKNFVALKNLLTACNNQHLFKILMEREQHELMQFWSLVDSTDWIGRLLNWCFEEKLLTQFINTYWSLEGFLHSVISYRLVNPKLQHKLQDLLRNFEPTPEKAVIAVHLQRCIMNRYRITCHLPRTISFPIHIDMCVVTEHQDLVATLFEDFQLEVRRQEKGINEIDAWINHLGKNCVTLVLTYLDVDNHKRLLEEDLPNRMRNYIVQLNPDARWAKMNRLIQAERQIEVLKRYLDSIERTKSKLGWQKIFLTLKSGYRSIQWDQCEKFMLGATLLFIIGTSLSFGFRPTTISKRNDVFMKLHQTKFNGTFCDVLYHVTEPDSYCGPTSKIQLDCKEVCNDLLNANSAVELITATGSTGVVCLFIIAVIIGACLLSRGRSWDRLKAEDISSDVANNQQTLLVYFAREETNPFADLNNNSDYNQVEAKASEVLAQVQPEYDQLSKELADTTEAKTNESHSSQSTEELADTIKDKKAGTISSQSTTFTSLDEILIDGESKSSSPSHDGARHFSRPKSKFDSDTDPTSRLISLDEKDSDGVSKTPPSSPGRAGYFSRSKPSVEGVDMTPLLSHDGKAPAHF